MDIHGISLDVYTRLYHELAKVVQSVDKIFELLYLKIFVDLLNYIYANRKITPQNGYLHTFSSVNLKTKWLSRGLMCFFWFFVL
jgi:hypothetical protein